MMRMVRGVRVAGWIAILAGILVSAVRVVLALKAQAFDQVAAAGVPALAGLFGGSVVIALSHAVESAAETRDLAAGLARDLCPESATGLIGLAAVVGGSLWIAYAFLSLDSTMRAWGVVLAGPGILAVGLGVVLMIVGAVANARGRRR